MPRDRHPHPFANHKSNLGFSDFASGVASGVIPVLDRFGHPLKVGHLVLCRMDLDPVCQVTSIAAVLNPKMPGLVKVTMLVEFPMMTGAATPTQNIIICGMAASKDAVAGNGQGAAIGVPGVGGHQRHGVEIIRPGASDDAPPTDPPPTNELTPDADAPPDDQPPTGITLTDAPEIPTSGGDDDNE